MVLFFWQNSIEACLVFFQVYPIHIPDLLGQCPLIISGRCYGKFPETLQAKGILADMSDTVIDMKVQNTKDFPLEKVRCLFNPSTFHHMNLFMTYSLYFPLLACSMSFFCRIFVVYMTMGFPAALWCPLGIWLEWHHMMPMLAWTSNICCIMCHVVPEPVIIKTFEHICLFSEFPLTLVQNSYRTKFPLFNLLKAS